MSRHKSAMFCEICSEKSNFLSSKDSVSQFQNAEGILGCDIFLPKNGRILGRYCIRLGRLLEYLLT
jgi:hypothetical protein